MPTAADDLTAWVYAAEIERALIDAEAEAGQSVAFASRPLTSRERQAGTRFGDIDAIVETNTEEGRPIIEALYAGAAAALMVELFGNEEGEDTETLEVAAAVAALTLLLSRPPRRYRTARDRAAGQLTGLIQDSYTGGILTVLDEAQSQGKDIARWVTPGVPDVLTLLATDIADHPWQRATERTLHDLQTPRRALEGTVTRGELTTLVTETSQKGTVDLLHQANQAALGEGRKDTADTYPGAFLLAIASEILDKATCGPCRAIDGTEFDTLAEAEAAYPSGYVSCEGGSRCRGVLVFLYDEPE